MEAVVIDVEEERFAVVPDSHLDLLKRPLFAHVSTMRPDGLIQSNPMWFTWDGSVLRLTTSTPRQKYRNVRDDDRVSVSVHDPDQPYRYVELRGRLTQIQPDAQGVFFDELADRYQLHLDSLPDRPQRVVLVVQPEQASWQ
ncbi:MAG: PPOX class F420-dependent oxidoreductase [Acidimicrobiales bacterium]